MNESGSNTMTIKEKILEALGGCVLDDISESRLIDILVDAHAALRQRIADLEGTNAVEREDLHQSQDRIQEEMHRMRSDPLYCAQGDYYFECNGRKFCVSVHGHRMELFERQRHVDLNGRQMTPKEWTAS